MYVFYFNKPNVNIYFQAAPLPLKNPAYATDYRSVYSNIKTNIT
jgi:hypothetical protein